MKTKITNSFLLFTLVFGLMNSYAQNYNFKNIPEYLNANSNWRLGKYILNYKDGNFMKQAVENLGGVESHAIVSHRSTGDLLFYLTGMTRPNIGDSKIFNKNHQLMLNGELIGVQSASTKQGSVVIPYPNDTNRFIVVELGDWLVQNFYGPTLRYHVVDMRLDGGLGGVVDTLKNISLEKYLRDSSRSLDESMIIVPGNNCDVWLVLHSRGHTSQGKYFVFHITEKGIGPTPKEYYGKLPPLAYAGILKISSNRKYLSYAPFGQIMSDTTLGSFELVEFNPETGVIQNPIIVKSLDNSLSDLEFSANSKYLYVSRSRNGKATPKLLRYDISVYDSLSIASSQYIIGDTSPLITSFKSYSNEIYSMNTGAIGDNAGNIGAIFNSDSSSVQYVEYKDSIYDIYPIVQVNSFGEGLYFSTDMVYPVEQIISKKVEVFCNDNDLTIYPTVSNASNYIWNNGSKDASYTFSKSELNENQQIYFVEYSIFSAEQNCVKLHVDTIYVNYYGIEEKPTISVSEDILSVEDIYDTYQWYLDNQILERETQNTLKVTKNGEYKVVVGNNGCEGESEPYRVNNKSSITEIQSKLIHIYPNPTSGIINLDKEVNIEVYDIGFKLLKSIDYSSVVDLGDFANGVYWLNVKTEDGLINQTLKVVKQD